MGWTALSAVSCSRFKLTQKTCFILWRWCALLVPVKIRTRYLGIYMPVYVSMFFLLFCFCLARFFGSVSCVRFLFLFFPGVCCMIRCCRTCPYFTTQGAAPDLSQVPHTCPRHRNEPNPDVTGSIVVPHGWVVSTAVSRANSNTTYYGGP